MGQSQGFDALLDNLLNITPTAEKVSGISEISCEGTSSVWV